jgi:uncharacterized protein (TIGR00730 family)
MKRICVFCGANPGKGSVYAAAARELGRYLAQNQLELVYGAGNVGLMGILADACLQAGGHVIGVIPTFLKEKEVCHMGLQELIVTDTMHQRKAHMEERSDGFIAMPGGYGTLDELAEILTWAQLGLHTKPIGLLNVEGYFDPLIAYFDSMQDKGFLHPRNREMVLTASEPAALLQKMQAYQAPRVEKWLEDPEQL